MSYQTRNGTLTCGVTEKLELSDQYSRPEFVAEHEARSAYLISMLGLWYPWLLSDFEQLMSMRFLLIHDGGERIGGDVLDDGSPAHEESRKRERKAMAELFECYPPEWKEKLRYMHESFENYGGEMAFPKAVDKVDAVLYQLFLWKHGRRGNVEKKRSPSERDLRTTEVLGTSNSADIWCLHYRISFSTRRSEAIDALDDILRVAFLDAYGEIPRCMTMDVKQIEIAI